MTSKDECPYCKAGHIIVDEERGEEICDSCGRVQSAQHIRSEPQFASALSGRPILSGQTIRLQEHSGIARASANDRLRSVLSNFRKAIAVVPCARSVQERAETLFTALLRKGGKEARLSSQSSSDVTTQPGGVEDEASVEACSKWRVYDYHCTTATCLYMAARLEKYELALQDVAHAFSISPTAIARTMTRYASMLHLRMPTISSKLFLERCISTQQQFSHEAMKNVRRISMILLDLLSEDVTGVETGRSRMGVAAAGMRAAAAIAGYKLDANALNRLHFPQSASEDIEKEIWRLLEHACRQLPWWDERRGQKDVVNDAKKILENPVLLQLAMDEARGTAETQTGAAGSRTQHAFDPPSFRRAQQCAAALEAFVHQVAHCCAKDGDGPLSVEDLSTATTLQGDEIKKKKTAATSNKGAVGLSHSTDHSVRVDSCNSITVDYVRKLLQKFNYDEKRVVGILTGELSEESDSARDPDREIPDSELEGLLRSQSEIDLFDEFWRDSEAKTINTGQIEDRCVNKRKRDNRNINMISMAESSVRKAGEKRLQGSEGDTLETKRGCVERKEFFLSADGRGPTSLSREDSSLGASESEAELYQYSARKGVLERGTIAGTESESDY